APGAHFNEIRFEDKKGHEELHVQAERNLSTVVKAGESRSVGGSRETKIGMNDIHHILGSQGTYVDGSLGSSLYLTKGPYYLQAKGIARIEAESSIQLLTQDLFQLEARKSIALGTDEVFGVDASGITLQAWKGSIYVTAKEGLILQSGAGYIAIDTAGNI